MKNHLTKTLRSALCLLLAAAIWLPCVHLFFKPSISDLPSASAAASAASGGGGGGGRLAQSLLNRQLALWANPADRQKQLDLMRQANPEWDFMGRTYLVLALANVSLRDPSTKPVNLQIIDAIIDETLRLEAQEGIYVFLMPYARTKPFIHQPPRSLFIDAEVALMIAARRMVQEKPAYKDPMWDRLNASIAQMQKSPILLAESYPDECWAFDHTTALAALKIADQLDNQDHSAFIQTWLKSAKKHLIDPKTGLLNSFATTTGTIGDGPEGTSLWMVVHCLQILDPPFAQDQYARASQSLDRGALGFAWASEWPPGTPRADDIDSGPTIPVLQLSTGSSGLAILAAASFNDTPKLTRLLTTLNLGGFPTYSDSGKDLHYAASNQVGDAVLLYALTQGPLWQKVLHSESSPNPQPLP
jgi:hypothetical protein